jgi:hypothetical protein
MLMERPSSRYEPRALSAPLGWRDVMVALEEVARVVQRLDQAQPTPRVGVEESACVGRLLDEVRVVATAVREYGALY